MNAWDLRVEEFWKRDGMDWVRVPALEVLLPDGHAKQEGRLHETE